MSLQFFLGVQERRSRKNIMLSPGMSQPQSMELLQRQQAPLQSQLISVPASLILCRPPQNFILETVRLLPPKKREKMSCVILNFQRQELNQPWGFTFSKMDGCIVIGKVNQEAAKPKLRWSQTVPAHDKLLDNGAAFLPIALQRFARDYKQIIRLHVFGETFPSKPINDDSLLLDGDLVVAVDGFDPSRFSDLTSFTTYMRSISKVTMVVLRHPEASKAASLEWHLAASSEKILEDTPLVAAASAISVWRHLFHPIQLQPLSTMANEFTRQVTPDRPDAVSTIQQARPAPSRVLFATQAIPSCKTMAKPQPKGNTKNESSRLPSSWSNPWFKTETGENLPFDDNFLHYPDDGERASLFLPPTGDFQAWLLKRKKLWRSKYKVVRFEPQRPVTDDFELEVRTVAYDFWSQQGFKSFDEWLSSSVVKWRPQYSWNKRKCQKIKKECEAIAQISEDPVDFSLWLCVRRNQWRLSRRKRQLERVSGNAFGKYGGTQHDTNNCNSGTTSDHIAGNSKRQKLLPAIIGDFTAIDAIIQEEVEDQKRRDQEKKQIFDLRFLFYTTHGAPDDIVVHCLSFLKPTEYFKLLCINKAHANALKSRQEVWRLLCPSHWILPRRPRKPWHELYFHRLKIEHLNSLKRWDDLLVKCSNELLEGDRIQKIERLVTSAEKEFGFSVNYVSPIVCERNSLLNLAVIHQRHKVVRWLVDTKEADIESYDRGHFTPLLNAAWAGDRQLVRFLLQRGANRSKIGLNHYTKGLAHPDFKGLNAESWAAKRGHGDISELIRLGL